MLQTLEPTLSLPKRKRSLKPLMLNHLEHMVRSNQQLAGIFTLADMFSIDRALVSKALRALISDGVVAIHHTNNATCYEVVGLGFTKWTIKGRRNDHGNAENIVTKPCMTCQINFPATHKFHRMCDTCKKNA